MDILYLLIPLSIVMAFVIGAFWWAARDGQFDDLEGPAHRILMDDESPQQSTSTGATLMEASPSYNYKVVRQFALVTVLWGIVGMAVGVWIAAQLTWPELASGFLALLRPPAPVAPTP